MQIITNVDIEAFANHAPYEINLFARVNRCLLVFCLHCAMSNSSPSMPPPSADLQTTWAFLEEGVDHIMTKLQTGVSYSKAFIFIITFDLHAVSNR